MKAEGRGVEAWDQIWKKKIAFLKNYELCAGLKVDLWREKAGICLAKTIVFKSLSQFEGINWIDFGFLYCFFPDKLNIFGPFGKANKIFTP